ncbi:hypothetical protein GUJ93_ZPchr0001g29888 [Zizania palustris]|uniref:Uncharacterized protein n=1 Tax=Zizania palustris TaxID=103762 RepID=A0A8J5RMU4_ZIZPA|nr:hypothetical protein GUJ93_ZPchr0001g29888 [Zizania palustris]
MASAVVMHRSSSDGGSRVVGAGDERAGWEVQPSDMVVQACEEGVAAGAGTGGGAGGVPPRPPPSEISVRVKYGSARHEVAVSSIATFGE